MMRLPAGRHGVSGDPRRHPAGGASEGLLFYLKPDFGNRMFDADGNLVLFERIFAAMGQAFFTLSLGIGAMAIFGSYIGKERRPAGREPSASMRAGHLRGL